MSEAKDIPELPDASDEKLLSGGDSTPQLAQPEEILELAPPEEILLLTPQHHDELSDNLVSGTTESADVPHAMTDANTDTDIFSDPSIFDTVGADAPLVSPVQEDVPSTQIQDTAISHSQDDEVFPPSGGEQPKNQGPDIQSTSLVTPNLDIQSDPVPEQSGNALRILMGILIFLILVGVSVGGYFFLSTHSEKGLDVQYTLSAEPVATSYEQDVAQRMMDDEKDITSLNRAISENNASFCQEIVSESRKTECQEAILARELTRSGTVSDCQKLTIATLRNGCVSATLQSSALHSLDQSLCSEITDTIQAQYCRELVDQQLLVQMTQSGTISQEGCSRLTDKYKQECMDSITQVDDSVTLQQAISSENLEACKTLSEEALQFTCFDTILLKQALKSGDKNLCDYVRDETKKNTCLGYMSKQDDNALFKTAIVEKNLNMCQDITMDTLRNRCHDSVTLLLVRDTKDIKLCDTLIATGSLEACKKSTGVQ